MKGTLRERMFVRNRLEVKDNAEIRQLDTLVSLFFNLLSTSTVLLNTQFAHVFSCLTRDICVL